MGKKEENLKKLSRTAVAMNFVKKHNGEWNHEQWEEFCGIIQSKYSPIDLDQVGLLLESKRETYLASKK